MTPFYTDDSVTLYHGDCLDILRELPDNLVDSVVTDPPYGLGFMGREWDDLPPGIEFAAECLRVLKPGGHLLAFGGSRTWHRLACAVEDAGFEIRDSIAWLYGSGFPKSLDVSKAIDKAAGAERDRVPYVGGIASGSGNYGGDGAIHVGTKNGDEPVTPDAQKWQGWGTALKPAFEPIVVGRKPLAGTVAANVLAYGTGALNVDGCRVGTDGGGTHCGNRDESGQCLGHDNAGRSTSGETVHGPDSNAGRWPSNVVLDESQAAALDAQSGTSTSNVRPPTGRDTRGIPNTDSQMVMRIEDTTERGHSDHGGASRFFPTFKYEPKAPTTERPRDGVTSHPTVKPLDLMRWLVRLVTPPGGTVLEPFAGSGTTAEACVVEGFKCIAIERESDYLPLIVQRLTKPIQVALDFD